MHPSMQAITLEVILRAVFGVSDEGRRARLRSGLGRLLASSARSACSSRCSRRGAWVARTHWPP